MDFDVITFGSAVVDTFVHTDVYEKKKFISYPVGAKILITDLKIDIGGGGTNTAVAFSRLGLKTGYIGKLGDDKNSVDILQCLRKENVKFLGDIDKKFMSGYSIILDSRGGERTILTYKGANDHLKFNELRLNGIKTRWLYYSALLGDSFKTQVNLAKKLVKSRTKLAFNPSSYIIKNLNIKPLLSISEILIINKEEAMMIIEKYGGDKKDLLNSLVKLGPKIVVVTDKNNPAVCYDGKKKYSIKPNDIKVKERTGAGDAFASGFVAGRIVNWPIEKCLEFGLKESESVIKYFGAKNILLKMDIKKKG